MFEDAKEEIRSRKSKKERIRTKEQTMISKTLHRKLMIELHNPHLKSGWAAPAPLVVPIMLLVVRQPLMLIIPLYCMLSREATNTNYFIVFGLYRTQDLPHSRRAHSYYTTNVGFKTWNSKTRQMSGMHWVQQITVSSKILCLDFLIYTARFNFPLWTWWVI